MAHTKTQTRRMAQMAILAAIVVLMAFTPLGYLRTGPVSITFLMIPVVIGAVVVGPAAGAILGGIFGVTSFIQCFGMEPFGTLLFGINPFFTFIMCMIPRILAGWLPGLLFKALQRIDRTKLVSYAASCLSGALLNTLLFLAGLLLFFHGNADVYGALGADSALAVITAIFTANALLEAAVCLVIGTAIAKVIVRFTRQAA